MLADEAEHNHICEVPCYIAFGLLVCPLDILKGGTSETCSIIYDTDHNVAVDKRSAHHAVMAMGYIYSQLHVTRLWPLEVGIQVPLYLDRCSTKVYVTAKPAIRIPK